MTPIPKRIAPFRLNRSLARFLMLSAWALLSQKVTAEPTHTALDAHEHGVAELTLAVVDTLAEVSIEIPAVHLFGFEQFPPKESQRRRYDQVTGQLHQGAWVRFNAEAKCSLKHREVHLPWQPDNPPVPAERPAMNHHESASQSNHADVSIVYRYQCRSIAKLNALTVDSLFKETIGLARVHYQALIHRHPLAGDLTPAQPNLIWSLQ